MTFHKIVQKGLPYLFVVVLITGVLVVFFGYSEQIQAEKTMLSTWKNLDQELSNTKAQLEAEKQNLQQKQQELANAMTQTQQLLEQLNAIKQESENLQDLIDKAESQSGVVTDKIEELEDAYNKVEDNEQQRWVLPIQYDLCTSYFGSRVHPVTGEETYHSGVDLAAALGTPIVAARSGTVEMATYDESSGYFVVIDHLDGYDSRYMHMQKYIVQPGQFVVTGQIIGYCGNSGVATGSHLHFAIFNKDNVAVNPANYMTIK